MEVDNSFKEFLSETDKDFILTKTSAQVFFTTVGPLFSGHPPLSGHFS